MSGVAGSLDAGLPVTFRLDPAASGIALLQAWMDAPESGGFPQLLRTRPVEAREGYVRVVCDINTRHANFVGLVHGGVTAALVDTAGGAAVMTILEPGQTLLTTDITLRLLNAAPIACARLEAVGVISWRDGRKVITEVVVSTASGLVIAQGSVGVSIRSPG
ncbi:MAG: PaaI family thioesterase [Candidatus Brevundimonas phytovorans]|nr:PaaI family thioesterase [Brevundimonas sp.]WEK58159.1 MAG: PaaI family thioesterase [Brevundimonas sp.]